MYDSNDSRRRFLRYLAGSIVVGTSVEWTGCKRKDSHPAPTPLNFWGTGTLDILDGGWKQALADIGVEVRFSDNGNDTGPVIAKMISGTASRDYDIGGLQGGAERELFEASTIVPWNLEQIPNWSSVWPMAQKIPYARIDGKQIGLPIALNADSIIYLPDKLKKIPGYENGIVNSYSVIFDDRLKGLTAMEDAWINSVIFVAIYLKENHILPINDPGDLSEAELTDVMQFLLKQKRAGQFRKFWRGWEQGVDMLASGEVIAMTGWEPIVYELQKRGINAKYAEPKEGYEGWSNDLLLHSAAGADRARNNAAHAFANWLYSGFYGCILSKLRGYAVPSDLAVKYASDTAGYDAASIKKLGDHVKSKFEHGGSTYWQNVRPKNYRLYEEKWNQLRQG